MQQAQIQQATAHACWINAQQQHVQTQIQHYGYVPYSYAQPVQFIQAQPMQVMQTQPVQNMQAQPVQVTQAPYSHGYAGRRALRFEDMNKLGDVEDDADDCKHLTDEALDCCSKGHPLRLMSHSQLVREHRSYVSGIICDECGAHGIGSARSAHCSRCRYDLCPDCYHDSASADSCSPEWISDSSYKSAKTHRLVETCERNHSLLKLSIAQLHKYSHYQSGHFICDVCFASSKKEGYLHSFHCPACRFDLCPKCFKKPSL